jgi:hypothetical protein
MHFEPLNHKLLLYKNLFNKIHGPLQQIQIQIQASKRYKN